MSGGRNAEMADAIAARGYGLAGFGPARVVVMNGLRCLVSVSRERGLCVVLRPRSFMAVRLEYARALYPALEAFGVV